MQKAEANAEKKTEIKLNFIFPKVSFVDINIIRNVK